MRSVLVLALVIATFSSGSYVIARTPPASSIEGRWAIDTGGYLSGVPRDLVVSVDNGRVYGMVDDFQIRGTVTGGKFSFEAIGAPKPTKFQGDIQADGMLTGTVGVTSGTIPGNQLTKNTRWTAKRSVIGPR
jgi:hypothetical protein